MKTIGKIICCMVALAWMSGAVAKEEAMHSSLSSDDEVADSVSADEGSAPAAGGSSSATSPAAANVAEAPAAAEDVVVSTPPAPRVPVMAHTEKVDRSQVEKKMEERSNRMKSRTADAEKDVAARAQPAQ